MGTSASPIGRDEESGSDQRQSARKVVPEPIAIELQPGREAWLRDLGEGGLSVSGNSRLELGTSATIRFELPQADSVIDASGVVTWSDESGRAGVRFTRVEADSTAALRRWLNSGATAHRSQPDATSYDHDLASKVACLREVADLQAIISSEHLETDATLNLIVRRMVELTRATGAAIALREGQDVICRASFGNAPDVGVKLSSSSLSGECLRSGALVMLEDSENDSRVNPDLCRQLNFRSLLILPVTLGTETIGIAEVLSANRRNFEGGDVLVVSFLTDLIASVAAPQKESPTAAYARFTTLPVLEPQPIVDSQPPSEVIAPASRLDAVQTSSLPVPRIVAARMDQKPAADEKPHRIEKDLSIRIPARGLRISVIAVVLAIVVLSLGYYYRHNRTSPKPNNTAPAAPSSTTSLASPSKPALSSSALRVPSNSGTAPKAAKIPRPARTEVTRPAEPELTEISVILGHTVNVRPAPEPSAPEPLAISALEPARSPSSLPTSIVAAKPLTPELSPVPSQGVTPGKLIKRVLPQYPDMARRAGVSGDVVIAGIIRTDGGLRNLKVLSGSPLLREAALAAAKQWRYSPYLLGGKPVEAETRITINFRQ